MQRERADQSLRHAIAPVADDRGGEAVALRRRRDQRADVIDERLSCGERARGAACRDDRRTALLHLRDELGLEPPAVDRLVRRLAADLGVGKVGVEGRRMVSPDREPTRSRSGYAPSSSSMSTPLALSIICGMSARRRSMSVSGPNISPEAMRGRSAYATCPVAPVTTTLTRLTPSRPHRHIRPR